MIAVRPAAYLLAVTLAATGCGTRVDPAPSGQAMDAPVPSTVTTSPTTPSFSNRDGGTLPAPAPRSPVASRPVGPAAPKAALAPGGPAGQGTTPTSSTAPIAKPNSPSEPAKPGVSSGTPTSPVRTGPSGHSPAILASVGTYSGPVGTVAVPYLQGAQLWVKVVNEQGGLNGHPVQLLVYDDGGDPARHRAQVQQAVERDRAIAFLQNVEPLTGEGSVEYITAKRVPVVGLSGGEFWAYSSPMYFPQTSVGDALTGTYFPAIAAQLKGKTRLGTLACVEAQACADAERVTGEDATRAGWQHVYRGRTSLAQPDFTAECLAARNQRVEVLYIFLDQNSVGRVGAACSRQGFHPTYAILGQPLVDRMKDDANLAGMVASSTVFPYFQTGTPATDEFQRAVRRHGRGIPLGVGLASGWTSGKLFEKAAADLPEPPTSEAILAGLWSLNGDTLGGITQPLTFTPNQPATPLSCWFNLAIRDRSWVSPDGFELHCR